MVSVCVCVVSVCVVSVCVVSVCVSVWREEAAGSGMKHRKEEPHTKMWGTKSKHHTARSSSLDLNLFFLEKNPNALYKYPNGTPWGLPFANVKGAGAFPSKGLEPSCASVVWTCMHG